MTSLGKVVILMTIILACNGISLDQRLLKALEVNETDEVLAKSGLRPKWNDFHIEGTDETFVKVQIDMLLSLKSAESAFPYLEFRSRKKRSAVRDQTLLWPRRVPFQIDTKFSLEEKLVIYKAMQQWMQYTCLEFVPKQDKDYAYIKFEANEYNGCASLLGMQKFPQPIYLADGCKYVDIVIHEIGHAIGLFHEHSRPDRDDYVKIYYENLLEGSEKDIDKGNWSVYANYSKPYDYLSIMHYSKNAFSKAYYLNTIVPEDASYLDRIGNGSTISFGDAFIVNTMYQCAKGCAKKVCPKNGFLGKDCECYCPGTDEDGQKEPVKLCTHQTYCDKPDIDQSVYYVFSDDDLGSDIQSLAKDFLNGTIIHVDFKDLDGCGVETSMLTCLNGKWEGTLPVCTSSTCLLPKDSISSDGNKAEKGEVMHGKNVSLSCPGFNNIKVLTCHNGTFNDTQTGNPYDVSTFKCRESPVYRIINEGRHCVVTYTSNPRYTITQDDVRQSAGDTVEHMTEVTASCDKLDVKGEFIAEDLMTFMTCKDGNWDGRPPVECPRAEKPCSLVANAFVYGPLETASNKIVKKYNVTCMEGHTLNTSPVSSCTFEGKWEPKTPVCVPNSCEVPRGYKTQIINSDGIEVRPGMKVKHGTTVTLQCKYGEVAAANSVECHLGIWKTANERLPACRKVVCPKTKKYPVTKAQLKNPEKNEYVFGDTLQILRCHENLELDGPEEIKCQKDGTWSATVTCSKFCKAGKSSYAKVKGHTLKGKLRRQIKFGRFTVEKCRKKCDDEKRFLCRAVSYGYQPGKGTRCQLFSGKITDESFIEKKSWEVSERKCSSHRSARKQG